VEVKRKKKCQNPECGEKFVPARMGQKACSVPCALVVGKVEAAKKERKQTAAKAESLLRRKDLIPVAQQVANKYARVRDHDEPCISCGKPAGASEALTGGGWDGGHYRSVGSAPHLRFFLPNIRKQCKHCNDSRRGLGGNHVEYRKGLRAKFGDAWVEALEADQAPRKHDIEWLKRFIKIMRKKTRRLEKRRGK
jgi:hypothetical protein